MFPAKLCSGCHKEMLPKCHSVFSLVVRLHIRTDQDVRQSVTVKMGSSSSDTNNNPVHVHTVLGVNVTTKHFPSHYTSPLSIYHYQYYTFKIYHTNKIIGVFHRDGKNPGFLEKTRWGGFNWFNTGLIGFNGQNG